MATIQSERGDFAIAYLEQSLAVLQRLRDANAPAVQHLLTQIRQAATPSL